MQIFRSAVAAMLLCMTAMCASAASVKVTMNSTSTTMSLKDKTTGTAVEVGEPKDYVYSFDAAAGTYVLTAYGTDGTTENGTIELTVADGATNEFTVLTNTAYATNSGWTLGTDYTLNVKVATKQGTYETITVGNSTSSGWATFLAMSGDSYFVDFVPSDAKKAQNYTTGYKNGTLTYGVTVSAAIPTSFDYSVTIPKDAEFFLGRKIAHYMPFQEIEPKATVTDGDNKVITYALANSQQYNFRTWMPSTGSAQVSNSLTRGGYFTANSTASKMPALAFTAADYEEHQPSEITRTNLAQTGDIMLNINERNYLNMTVGETKDITGLRSWQAVDNYTNNYYLEPDFHFTVKNLNGEPDESVIKFDKYNTTWSPWTTLTAVGAGTAIVTVTYDAMNLQYYKSGSATATDYALGPFFGAIWPENTGVFIVTVGEDGSTSIQPNMKVNENTTYTISDRTAGYNVDAELDVFYYQKDEDGYHYTFTPEGATTVDVAYPTIGDKSATYSAFTNVVKNADDSYTLILKQGRNIVRMTDANGKSVYQVMTAKECEMTITDAKDSYNPGDEIAVTYNVIYHPCNKLSGVYNMSAVTATNNGQKLGTANQYAFASTANAQKATFVVPRTAEAGQLTITDGCFRISGYGDPYGGHRDFSRACGKNPNFTAVTRTAFFGKLPAFNITVNDASRYGFCLKTATTPDEVVVKDVDGNVYTADVDGYYYGVPGTYTYEVWTSGYKYVKQTVTLTDASPEKQEVEVALTSIPDNGWDGNKTVEPAKITEEEAATAEYADMQNYYKITTGFEMAWLMTQAQNSVKNLKAVLANDITLSDCQWLRVAPATQWATVPSFNGIFEGNGHTVSGLYSNTTQTYAALFGYCSGATIKNLTVEGSITTTANYAAGIAAYATGTTIQNCVNRVTINGKQYASGICGNIIGASLIDRCVNEAAITGTSYVSGIVSYPNAATVTVTNNVNKGNIAGTGFVSAISSNCNANTVIQNNLNLGELTIISGTNTTIGNVYCNASTMNKISNNYVLKNYQRGTAYETVVTEDQLASGEVALLLGEAFGQQIGVDKTPVLGGMKVFYDEANNAYTNDDPLCGYTLAVLTFEDKDYKGGKNFAGKEDWSSLIDNPQYQGALLYESGGFGYSSADDAYQWTDANNTWLHSILSEGYGAWAYWSGGHAVSNYGSGEQATYGDYNSQLTVFHKGVEGLTQAGNGHNGSNNFAVHYGYSDNSGYSLTEDALPALSFADGKARVIDHMYVTNTCYAINCYVSGNGLTPSISESDWVKIVATGYNGTEKGKTAEMYLCNGPKHIVMDWTKFDLSSLGEVTKVTFNVTGSSDNGYGFSQPAYFAYDDVAVRMPKDKPTMIENVKTCDTCADKIYDIYGRRLPALRKGINIVNGKKILVK